MEVGLVKDLSIKMTSLKCVQREASTKEEGMTEQRRAFLEQREGGKLIQNRGEGYHKTVEGRAIAERKRREGKDIGDHKTKKRKEDKR